MNHLTVLGGPVCSSEHFNLVFNLLATFRVMNNVIMIAMMTTAQAPSTEPIIIATVTVLSSSKGNKWISYAYLWWRISYVLAT